MRVPGSSLSAFLAAAALLAPAAAFHPCSGPISSSSSSSSSSRARLQRSGWVGGGGGARRTAPRTTTPSPPSPPKSSFFEDDFGEYSDFADAARSSSNNGGGGGSSANFPPATDRSSSSSSSNLGSSSSSSSSSAGGPPPMSDDLFLASLRARRDELARTYASQARRASSSSSATSSSRNNGNGNGGGVDDPNDHDRYVDDELRVRWLNADISSAHAGLALSDDWIRRVAFHRYPLAVCGTAGGSIVAADLESGEELCRAEGAHGDDFGTNDEDEVRRDAMGRAMTMLYGDFDGGGVLSVATWGDWIASSGRDLGARLHRLDPETPKSSSKMKLTNVGRVEGLEEILVTGLAFDSDGALWVGGFDLQQNAERRGGIIRCYDVDGEADRAGVDDDAMRPLHEIDLGAEVLSLSIEERIGCGVAALADGRVTLFSLDEGEILDSWRPPFRGYGTYARTALVVQNAAAGDAPDEDDDEGDVWSVACGASDGTMFVRRLRVEDDDGVAAAGDWGRISEERPFHDNAEEANHLAGPLRPRHSERVVALASPFRGVLVSGAQDGSIRVWDCSYPRLLDLEEVEEYEEEEEGNYDDVGADEDDLRPRCLYAMTGYKVWLGSICTDGKRIVSDGSDNAIIVHDFRPEAGTDDFLELD